VAHGRLTLILFRAFGDLIIQAFGFDESLRTAVAECVNRFSLAVVAGGASSVPAQEMGGTAAA
jgi:hypothetical protein